MGNQASVGNRHELPKQPSESPPEPQSNDSIHSRIEKLKHTADALEIMESLQIGSCFPQTNDMCTLRPNCSLVSNTTSPTSKSKKDQCVLSVSWLSVVMRLLDAFYKSPRHAKPPPGLRTFNFVEVLIDILVAAQRQRPHVRLGTYELFGKDDVLHLQYALPSASFSPSSSLSETIENMFASLNNQLTVEWVPDLITIKNKNATMTKKELKDDKLWLDNIDHRNILVMICYLLVRMNCTKNYKDQERLLMWNPAFCQDILVILASASYDEWVHNIDSMFPLEEKTYTYSPVEAQNTFDLFDLLYIAFVSDSTSLDALLPEIINYKSVSFTDLQSV